MTSAARISAADLDAQHERFRAAFRILNQAIEDRFPLRVHCRDAGRKNGCARGIRAFHVRGIFAGSFNEQQLRYCLCHQGGGDDHHGHDSYERGLLDLEAPITGMLPEFAGGDKRRAQVTFHMLLAHSSGLPAYEKLFLRAYTREALLREAFAVPLKHDPGTHAEYSDIGFILLGMALERIAGEPLDSFCQREVFGPLGMANTAFNPPVVWRDQIVPTAQDLNFKKRVIQGEVQDENASVMGAVAGHAGVSRPQPISRHLPMSC